MSAQPITITSFPIESSLHDAIKKLLEEAALTTSVRIDEIRVEWQVISRMGLLPVVKITALNMRSSS